MQRMNERNHQKKDTSKLELAWWFNMTFFNHSTAGKSLKQHWKATKTSQAQASGNGQHIWTDRLSLLSTIGAAVPAVNAEQICCYLSNSFLLRCPLKTHCIGEKWNECQDMFGISCLGSQHRCIWPKLFGGKFYPKLVYCVLEKILLSFSEPSPKLVNCLPWKLLILLLILV